MICKTLLCLWIVIMWLFLVCVWSSMISDVGIIMFDQMFDGKTFTRNVNKCFLNTLESLNKIFYIENGAFNILKLKKYFRNWHFAFRLDNRHGTQKVIASDVLERKKNYLVFFVCKGKSLKSLTFYLKIWALESLT